MEKQEVTMMIMMMMIMVIIKKMTMTTLTMSWPTKLNVYLCMSNFMGITTVACCTSSLHIEAYNFESL